MPAELSESFTNPFQKPDEWLFNPKKELELEQQVSQQVPQEVHQEVPQQEQIIEPQPEPEPPIQEKFEECPGGICSLKPSFFNDLKTKFKNATKMNQIFILLFIIAVIVFIVYFVSKKINSDNINIPNEL